MNATIASQDVKKAFAPDRRASLPGARRFAAGRPGAILRQVRRDSTGNAGIRRQGRGRRHRHADRDEGRGDSSVRGRQDGSREAARDADRRHLLDRVDDEADRRGRRRDARGGRQAGIRRCDRQALAGVRESARRDERTATVEARHRTRSAAPYQRAGGAGRPQSAHDARGNHPADWEHASPLSARNRMAGTRPPVSTRSGVSSRS